MAICTVAQYRAIIGDTTTADATVQAALDDAQVYLQEESDREFELAERTEFLVVDHLGYVYPRALPLEAVTVPTNSTVDGSRVLVGSLLNLAINPSERIVITYTGGYAPDAFPIKLIRLVARLAEYFLPTVSDLPRGITSASVGDVSYTAAESLADNSALMRDVRSWDRSRLEWY